MTISTAKIDCEDPAINQQTRAAMLRLRARVARRPGRWRQRMLRRPPDDPPGPPLLLSRALVEAA